MPKFTPLLAAALLGGVAGGALIWALAISRQQTHITIAVEPPAVLAEAPEQVKTLREGVAVIPIHPKVRVHPATPPPAPHPQAAAPAADLAPQSPTADSSQFSSPAQSGHVQVTSFVRGVPAPPAYSRPTPSPIQINPKGTDAALSFALEAAEPCLKEGFTMRDDFWAGDLPVKSSKAIVHQLFRGNEYWFWMGTDTPAAKISVHIYDGDGKLAEVESWQKSQKAAARVVPKRTGPYYLIVEIEESPEERTAWALAYGFR